jgi:hypothetical protein
MQVEFNKAAQSLTDAIIPAAQKKLALTRLVKVQAIWKLQTYHTCYMVGYYLTYNTTILLIFICHAG